MRRASRLGWGKMLRIAACAAMMTAFMTSSAKAVLLAYDGFDYTPGALLVDGGVGLGGATDGWAGGWDEVQAASFSSAIQADSLSYMDSLGNALVTSGGKLLATGDPNTSQPGRYLAERRVSPEAGDTVTTWLSFLGQRIGEPNMAGDQYDGVYRRGANLALFDLDGNDAQAEKLNLGGTSNTFYPVSEGVNESRWGVRTFINAAIVAVDPYPPNPTGAPTALQIRDAYSDVPIDEMALVVVRIDHVAGRTNAIDISGNDNWYVWVNPDLGTEPSIESALKFETDAVVARSMEINPEFPPAPFQSDSGGELNLNRLRLFAGNANAGQGTNAAQLLFDELRLGETFGDVTPFIAAPAGLAGDYNDDGVVDAADYTVYRDHLGDADETALNGNGDGMNGVDIGDYTRWVNNFGSHDPGSASLGAGAVPEPGTILLAVCAMVGMALARRRTA